MASYTSEDIYYAALQGPTIIKKSKMTQESSKITFSNLEGTARLSDINIWDDTLYFIYDGYAYRCKLDGTVAEFVGAAFVVPDKNTVKEMFVTEKGIFMRYGSRVEKKPVLCRSFPKRWRIYP